MSRPARPRDDDGAVLMYVLALVTIGTLFVLPLMTYAVAVLRQNSALSSKTARDEALKAGLRVSLSDPAAVYQTCGQGGPTAPVTLAPLTVGKFTVTSKCYYIGFESAQTAAELRYGLVATQVGASAPSSLSGSRYVPASPTSTVEWRSATTPTSVTDRIWLPNLPVHALDRRSPTGYQMPTGYPTCTVYFPGTYVDTLVLTGPTYFVSGIYYFENEVRVQSGASVVVGMGAHEGCTDDQQAAFYAVNAPASHNITGLGGTFVFGASGRLTVSNSGGSPVALRFNARYVAPEEAGSDTSAGVSIASVNGELSAGGAGIDLDVVATLSVPLSLVGATTPVDATTVDYRPSTFTPKPGVPGAPTAVAGSARNGAAIVSWSAPTSDGGSPITGYVVTASTGQTCTTITATSCAFTGLTNGSPVTFSVVASNAAGASAASGASAAVTPSTAAATLTAPSAPSAPTAVPYDGTARVSFTAPANGGAPITLYTVTAVPGGQTCTVDARVVSPTLRCDVVGLTTTSSSTFLVTATNAVGPSSASPASNAVVPATFLGPPPATTPTAQTPFQPTPIIEIDLPSTAEVTVIVPGYVAVPQGRLRISNPHGRDVQMLGGIVAAQYDVNDHRAEEGAKLPIGLTESIVQRKFRIVSSIAGVAEESTAVVQVNQNGAYAINTWEVQ